MNEIKTKLKMKFYGNGVVWDKENNKSLCRFVKGELETDDERVATILHTLGYKSESEGYKNYEVDYEEMTYNELRELAKGKGLKVGRKSKANLIEALKEGE